MPDLSTWNLTIPQGRPAITISTSQLQRDYRSDYFQRTADGIRFWVPVNGSHTRNSEFPRSELRETLETLSSGRPYNWRYARADNWLEATLRIEAVPSTRRMIIGQIHSDGSNSGQAAPLVKLLYQLRLDQGRVQALVREQYGRRQDQSLHTDGRDSSRPAVQLPHRRVSQRIAQRVGEW